jgi:signal transduction histidine kinase
VTRFLGAGTREDRDGYRGAVIAKGQSGVFDAEYRIVQEALMSVSHHATVNEARVRLWTKRGRLCVQIEDIGAGFVLDQAQAGYASSGLTGMQEKAGLLGG